MRFREVKGKRKGTGIRLVSSPSLRSGDARNDLSASASQFVDDQEEGAAADGDVRDVEGGPVPALPVEVEKVDDVAVDGAVCLLYTSPSPRDRQKSRMPSSA